MFSRFRGKSSKPDTAKDAPDSRGLEVREDDPDTAWSMWNIAMAQRDLPALDLPPNSSSATPGPAPATEPAASMQPEVFKPFPDLEIPTMPLSLEDASPAQRMKVALDIVEMHHHRIANTIRTLWGYKECSVYINKLIMNGGDGMGNARIGFNQEAADAMMILGDLHDAEFGVADGNGLGFEGFSGHSGHSGYNGNR